MDCLPLCCSTTCLHNRISTLATCLSFGTRQGRKMEGLEKFFPGWPPDTRTFSTHINQRKMLKSKLKCSERSTWLRSLDWRSGKGAQSKPQSFVGLHKVGDHPPMTHAQFWEVPRLSRNEEIRHEGFCRGWPFFPVVVGDYVSAEPPSGSDYTREILPCAKPDTCVRDRRSSARTGFCRNCCGAKTTRLARNDGTHFWWLLVAFGEHRTCAAEVRGALRRGLTRSRRAQSGQAESRSGGKGFDDAHR